jgi:hypothetical protein
MHKPSIRSIVETIGIFGVIASLLFVGMQLQLDRQVALGGQYHDRTESRKADARALLESEAWMSRISKEWESGSRPGWWTDEFEQEANQSQLTGAEVYARIYRIELALLQMDNNFYQTNQDLLSPEFGEANREYLKNFLREPFAREAAIEFGGGIVDIVAELNAEIENE